MNDKVVLERVAQDAEAMRLQLDRQTRHNLEVIGDEILWSQYEAAMVALNGLKMLAKVKAAGS